MPSATDVNYYLSEGDVAQIVRNEPATGVIFGREVKTETIRSVELADGRKFVMCGKCSYARSTVAQVSPHLKKHTDRSSTPVTNGVPIRSASAAAELLQRFITEQSGNGHDAVKLEARVRSLETELEETKRQLRSRNREVARIKKAFATLTV